jgi:hypothetical protein
MIDQFNDFFNASKGLNIIKLEVPEYVKFINDWKDFRYPTGHVIFDKTICGCGFTEYCLSNEYPTILCSPRKILLENKIKQHKGDKNIYYFKNEKDETISNYDSEVENGLAKEEVQKLDDVSEEVNSDVKEQYIVKIKRKLSDWLGNCEAPNPKVLVTYDSLRHVISVLGSRISEFNIVIDEFQSIFCDSSFKADVELNFVQLLRKQSNQNVLYLSATPMLERYLGIMDYFKDLPFYKLVWPDNKIETINIDREYTTSINTSCVKLIQEYKNGIFPRKILPDKSVHVSKEIVFFVNSVKTICDIIRKAKLTPEECNIICSQTTANISKIKRLGSKFDYGDIPTRDEPTKMFTFCTRTAYLGADFYSQNALTVICSNINIKTLIVDISLDLPQIVGRQRLETNVFKNDVKILYTGKSKKTADVSLDEFLENEKEKEKSTKIQLDAYNKMNNYEKIEYSQVLADRVKFRSYTKSYVGIDSNTGYAAYNYLAKISCLRSYEISRPDYQEKVLIRKDLDTPDNLVLSGQSLGGLEDFIDSFRSEFKQDENFERRMKMYYRLVTEFPDIYKQNIKVFHTIIPSNYQGYMNLLGPERIKANYYKESSILEEMESVLSVDNIKAELQMKFLTGRRYSTRCIKTELAEIYSRLGVKKAAKASDLEDWFDLKSCTVLNPETNKWDRGFEILSVK